MNQTPDARARDNQTRQIQEKLDNVEKHFGEMCQLFAGYTRKTARLREKADLLVREIGLYADTETSTLKRGIKQYADHLAKIQDYRQAEVERLEAKVIEPLKSYGAVVKRKKEDLKTTQSARESEVKMMALLDNTRTKNPSDRQIIALAEIDLQKATTYARRKSKQLEETMKEFEKQKIRDIKKVFSEFITVEMSFHAKALEVYTSAHQSIQSVAGRENLEVIRSPVHPPDYNSRLDIVRPNSQKSLNRTVSFLRKSGNLQQQRAFIRQTRGEDEDK